MLTVNLTEYSFKTTIKEREKKRQKEKKKDWIKSKQTDKDGGIVVLESNHDSKSESPKFHSPLHHKKLGYLKHPNFISYRNKIEHINQKITHIMESGNTPTSNKS